MILESDFNGSDHDFMKIALRLSERGRGYTEPNPMVGAVAVRGGRIIGTGFHAAFGSSHAERIALSKVRGGGITLYVTLEPCAHKGKTPPCTELLIEKGVHRVIFPVQDPNPLVNGRGRDRLKSAGIFVEEGLLAEWAEDVNRHYFTFMRKKRPYFAVHAGMSIDGRMTDKKKNSRWVTSNKMRMLSHSLRGEFSAILAGRETVEKDNPQLTIRHPFWREKKMYRVVLDSDNRLSPECRVFSRQENFPLILFSSEDAADRTRKTAHHFFCAANEGMVSLSEVARILHELGIASVLIEGGGTVIDSFIRAGLVDEYYLFTASKLIGGESSISLFPTGVEELSRAFSLRDVRIIPMDDGWLVRGRA